MPIYTKKGDKGQTDLFDEKDTKKLRVFKDDLRLQIIGSIDELNSCLGVITSLLDDKKEIVLIRKIQRDLFLINSLIAGIKNIKFPKTKVNYLEKEIDLREKKLPKLTNFILPGGTLISSDYHLARSITRRAERVLVSYLKLNKINSAVLVFINRLSDLFFVLARSNNHKLGVKDVIWNK